MYVNVTSHILVHVTEQTCLLGNGFLLLLLRLLASYCVKGRSGLSVSTSIVDANESEGVIIVLLQVHGPRGKFNITTEKVGDDQRRVLVSYHPTDVGGYMIEVVWADVPVPGSPFSLFISHTTPQHIIRR